MQELKRHLKHPFTLVAWLGSAAVATVTGPFGTYLTMSPVPRLFYWAGLIAAAIIIAYAVRVAIVRLMPPMARWKRDMLMPVLFTIFFTPVLEVVNHDILGWTQHSNIEVLGHAAFNLMAAAGVVLIRRLAGRPFLSAETEFPLPGEPEAVRERTPLERPRLYARFDAPRGRIVRLTVDDHYVTAVFDDGSQSRLLMRFADAVAEMEGQEGFLTHRSHWVSADAVLRAARLSGRDAIELVDGSVVPLSRTYRRDAEARGLFPTAVAEALPSE